MLNTILFDFDGTVTDTGEGILKSVQYTLRRFGRPADDLEKLRCFVGPPPVDTFQYEFGMSPEEAEEALWIFRKEYRARGLVQNTLYPGMDDMLRRLRGAGKTLAVATSKPTELAVAILDSYGLTEVFDLIEGSPLDGHRTTKIQVMEAALNKLNLTEKEKTEAVMVGDRSFDIDGANHFGLKSIGVRYGYAKPGELEAAGATWCVDTVPELEALLMRA